MRCWRKTLRYFLATTRRSNSCPMITSANSGTTSHTICSMISRESWRSPRTRDRGLRWPRPSDLWQTTRPRPGVRARREAPPRACLLIAEPALARRSAALALRAVPPRAPPRVPNRCLRSDRRHRRGGRRHHGHARRLPGRCLCSGWRRGAGATGTGGADRGVGGGALGRGTGGRASAEKTGGVAGTWAGPPTAGKPMMVRRRWDAGYLPPAARRSRQAVVAQADCRRRSRRGHTGNQRRPAPCAGRRCSGRRGPGPDQVGGRLAHAAEPPQSGARW